jgi:hypothetical protein
MGDTFDLKGKIIGLKPIPAGTKVEILVPGVGGFASYPATKFSLATGEYEFRKVPLDTAEFARDNEAVFLRLEVPGAQPPNEAFGDGSTLARCRTSDSPIEQNVDASRLSVQTTAPADANAGCLNVRLDTHLDLYGAPLLPSPIDVPALSFEFPQASDGSQEADQQHGRCLVEWLDAVSQHWLAQVPAAITREFVEPTPSAVEP